ncbi:GNAT family N-acetyltransferase [Pedobacter metabolipauper]|uniref:L-amino acid N-acyltransferase YncA n=1 Tax=Pedobacter metabolipauper TaxID=425513 RepID=A0A4R6SV59_9SPHI|nr:GNAT family N-acetyltransferase [Pedobacter metabolipauper]TDQ08329.1 L-amino acid N-acyltransferase YncA [Pedobacter metabolipauper]
MIFEFREANPSDTEVIWDILQEAILRRKNDGSNQWQDGYPNRDILGADIENDAGYVLTEGEKVIGYCAVLVNDEPEYTNIVGKWLSHGDFLVVHRIVVAGDYAGKGLARQILFEVENLALAKNIFSIKVDTNFDNIAMIKTFEKLGYVYCGEVTFRGSPRRAYEKIVLQI